MESDDRMDGSPVLIGLLIFLVCCSAFFSASETALTSLSRIRLRNMVEENVKNADLIMRLLEDPNRLLSSILVKQGRVCPDNHIGNSDLPRQFRRRGDCDHCDYRYHSDFRGNYS